MKTAIVKLKDVLDFADGIGYHVVGRYVEGGEKVSATWLAEDADLSCEVSFSGISLDFMGVIFSTCGVFAFTLIS
jgi:hypothetical protein